MLAVKIHLLHPAAKTPEFAHGPLEDAGMDLYSVEPVVLRPHVPTLVKCGFSMAIPSGYHAEVRPRSGLALNKGITVYNAPGTIDPSYRGEVGVILYWSGLSYNNGDGTGEFTGEHWLAGGSKIAQMVFVKYEVPEMVEVDVLGNSERGTGGFGSTGV